MSPTPLGAETIPPLLLDLARALTARQLYPSTHVTFGSAVQRAAGAWRDALSRVDHVEVRLSDAGIEMEDGTPVRGLGLEDFTRELRRRGIRVLRMERGVGLDDLTAFLDTLVDETGCAIPEGGFEGLLRAYGVQHLTTLPAAARPGADTEASSAEARRDGHGASSNTVELVQLLAALDQCEDLGEYRLAANRIDSVLNRLLAAKNCVDAYRAGLVYCRHAAGVSGWPPAIREEARRQLRVLHQSPQMVEFVVERACAPSGLTSVQAVQVLAAVGPPAVSHLLQVHESENPELRERITAILITMADEAIPSIIDELGSGNPARVRRAARLLGDMQHPRGAEFLADALVHGQTDVRREAARALVRIGSAPAVRMLARALEADDEISPLAASCLGVCGGDAAIEALLAAIQDAAGRSETARIEAIRSLGRIGDEVAVPGLCEVLNRRPLFGHTRLRPIRVAAAQALGQIGGEAAYVAVQPRTSDGDAAVSQSCRRAVRQIEGAAEGGSEALLSRRVG